ncbi:MAGUK p55 subfamily member 4 like [Melia azedarach]|uniref:MAGUK p55 subfamily member 4 like n=1 Tax=Melia azedarach TaxID=155640 RepID=A0ACC1XCH0_MELAZ|nr:MAGUK p55 subfamily member 4 like [Melia azedarach]
MDWWHRMRRVWISVSARLKHSRKPGGSGGGTAGGLLNLRDDVQTCGYNDVQVMWNMLYKSSPQEQKEVVATVAVAPPPHNPKCSKQRFSLRFLFWSDHRSITTSSSVLLILLLVGLNGTSCL